MKPACICLLFLLGSCLRLYSQALQLTSTAKKYPVNYPMYLEDRHGNFNFESIKDSGKSFRKSKLKVPDFVGNFSRAIWYKFEAVNYTNNPEWFIEIKGGYMHEQTLYEPDSAGVYHATMLNAGGNFSQRPVKSNNLVFPVTIRPGEQKTFYLRSTSKTLIRASISLSTMQQLYETSIFHSYGNGFFSALAVALLIYNLFVYFSLREKVYLYYIGYIFTTILHTNLVAGNILTFFPWLDWLNTTLLLPVLAFFSILFTNSFLQTRRYAPFIYRIRRVMTLLCLVPLPFFWAGEYAIAIVIVSALMFLLFIYWLTAGILAYRNSFQPAIYYIIGFGALITMNMLFELKIVGWMDESYWIDSALYIGSALEAIILSFALASKINFYKTGKERVQQQAYEQAVNFSRELINMQEAERKRIASELHDSVGQKLILIKNKILRFTNAGAAGFQQNPEALAESVADAIQEIRSISYGLRPYQIDLLGLTQSIKSLVSESFDATHISYSLQVDNADSITDQDMQINIYRIVQECVNNIIKHSGATSASVVMRKNTNQLTITIADDGKGFDPTTAYDGFGLKGLHERLHIMQGKLTVDSAAGTGSLFTIIIPL